MRKFILIAAMVLASATAQAGTSRGLILASSDDPVTAAEPAQSVDAPKSVDAKAVDVTKPAETPASVARPAAVDTALPADQSKPMSDKSTAAARAEKPKRRHESTEARVIYELHRHGIYW